MRINGKDFTTIWTTQPNPESVKILDQRMLPFQLVIEDICSLEAMCTAIRDMHLRGAPLIGVAAAFGMYLAVRNMADTDIIPALLHAGDRLTETRPTAVNLKWAVHKILAAAERTDSPSDKIAAVLTEALAIRDFEIKNCRKIGEYGLPILREIASRKQGTPVNILTHCNAGWLACVDYGTATAPVYAAHNEGIPVHVWVDETRPRNQGARLTAFELGEHGVPHTVIADNTGGHLMQHNMVDMVIVGSDRTSGNGDVCNKIGTYLKALAAKDNNIPFYVALPSSTIDFSMSDGVQEIPIERRSADEVAMIQGLHDNELQSVRLIPEKSGAANYAFDVTPARLVTGLITERGICKADKKGIDTLFGDSE